MQCRVCVLLQAKALPFCNTAQLLSCPVPYMDMDSPGIGRYVAVAPFRIFD